MGLVAGVVERSDAASAQIVEKRRHPLLMGLGIDGKIVLAVLPVELLDPAVGLAVLIPRIKGHAREWIGRVSIHTQNLERLRIDPETVRHVARQPDRSIGHDRVQVALVRPDLAVAVEAKGPAAHANPLELRVCVRVLLHGLQDVLVARLGQRGRVRF